MIVTLTLPDGSVVDCVPVRTYAIAECACPCGEARLMVTGRGQFNESHDTRAADAFAKCCNRRVGMLRVKFETLFGIEEDDAVLNARARVYG